MAKDNDKTAGVGALPKELIEQPDLTVREIYVERVFNLGSYETTRIGMHATVSPGEDPVEVAHKVNDACRRYRQEMTR